MHAIFISYRRADSQLWCDRIFDYLTHIFGVQQMFRDLNTIQGGEDFPRMIDEGLRHCRVVLAIIGPQWSGITDAAGKRRLDDPNDFVRLEIEGALRLNLPVIPVMVQGAVPLRPEELPPSLQTLAFRHARLVRPDPDFARDMQTIMLDVAQFVPIPGRGGSRIRGLWSAAGQVASLVVGVVSFLLLVAALGTWFQIPVLTPLVHRILVH